MRPVFTPKHSCVCQADRLPTPTFLEIWWCTLVASWEQDRCYMHIIHAQFHECWYRVCNNTGIVNFLHHSSSQMFQSIIHTKSGSMECENTAGWQWWGISLSTGRVSLGDAQLISLPSSCLCPLLWDKMHRDGNCLKQKKVEPTSNGDNHRIILGFHWQFFQCFIKLDFNKLTDPDLGLLQENRAQNYKP